MSDIHSHTRGWTIPRIDFLLNQTHLEQSIDTPAACGYTFMEEISRCCGQSVNQPRVRAPIDRPSHVGLPAVG